MSIILYFQALVMDSHYRVSNTWSALP